MITTTRIDAADLERLRILAKANRRSMTQELGALLDQATLDQTANTPPKLILADHQSVAERMAEMKPEQLPEAWKGPVPEE